MTASVCKMIVLITPPVPFNAHRVDQAPDQAPDLVPNLVPNLAPDLAPQSHSGILHYCWARRLWKIRDISFHFLVGTSGKFMAFFLNSIYFLKTLMKQSQSSWCWKKVNHGRKLVKARKTNEQKNEAGRDWSPVGRLASKVQAGILPPAADAGHVCVKLTWQTAAGAALQEGGPDGRLEQLPPVLVQFWRTR